METLKNIKVDTKVSDALRQQIQECDILSRENPPKLNSQEQYEAFEAILRAYQNEKGSVKTEGIHILWRLFEAHTTLTKIHPRTKKIIPYWSVNIFNYSLLNGRDKLARYFWELIDGRGMKASTVRCLAPIARDLVLEKGLSLDEAFQAILEKLPLSKDGLSFKGVWAPTLRKELGISPKNRPARVKKGRGVKLNLTEAEAQSVRDAEDAVSRYVTERLASVPEERHAEIRQDTMAQFQALFAYINRICQTAGRVRKIDRKREYSEACSVLGVEIGDNGFTALARAKKRHRALSFNAHPDQHPGLEKEFDGINKAWAIIKEYHQEFERRTHVIRGRREAQQHQVGDR